MSFVTENHPGVVAGAPAATQGFVLNHAMLRVKDPDSYCIEIVEPARLKGLGR